MNLSILALAWVPLRQAEAPAAASLHDRVIEIVLDDEDRVLPGKGVSARVEHEVGFSGTLHVWTKAAGGLDTHLWIEDARGEPVAEDDDSGGKPTPYVELEVEPGTKLTIAVAASQLDGVGKLELHLVAAPETETTRAEAEHAGLRIAEIRALRRKDDLAAARERAEALAEHFLDVAGGTQSEAMMRQAWALTVETEALGLLGATERMKSWVFAHRTRTLPDDHPELQRARQALAAALFPLGDLEGARSLFEKVLEVRSRTLPGDHPDLQWARLNYAAAIKTLGDIPSALPLQEQAVEVFSRTLSEDHPDLQAARGNLAATLFQLGRPAEARALQELVLAVSSRILPGDHSDLQRARENLANTLSQLGRLEAARTLQEQVLQVRSRTLPDDHLDLQWARGNLANTIAELGDLAGARALQEKVVEVLSRTLPDDHPDLQWARSCLASTIGALGDLAGERALEEKVLEISSRTLPDDHPDLQIARGNLASTIGALGDLAGARALEEKVLEVRSRTLPDDHLHLQAARLNLAASMKAAGDLAGARALEVKVLEVFSLTLPEDRYELLAARGNLAATLYEMGDFAGARALQERVLAVRRRTLPDEHPDLQLARYNLAITIARQAAARGATRQAPDEEARAEFAGLVLEHARGLRRAAVESVLGASGREAEERVTSGGALGHALSLADGYGVFPPDPVLEEEAFLLSEATRNVALLSARLTRGARSDPAWAELRERMVQATDDLAAQGREGGSGEDFSEARTRLEEVQRELAQLGNRLDPGAIADLEGDVAACSSRLGERDAFVGYRRYRRSACGDDGADTSAESLCAFVLRPESRLARVELGPIEPIEGAVEQWRSAIGAGSGPSRGIGAESGRAGDPAVAGEALRRLVFDPIVRVARGADRILVAPDDLLHLVPFDALPAGDASRMLGDVFRIELRSSLLGTLDDERVRTGASNLLAVGGVDYGAGDHDDEAERAGVLRGSAWAAGFARLPGAVDEARGIAAIFGDPIPSERVVELLEGARASRQNLLALAAHASFLHIATHGWFAPDSIRSSADPEPLDRKLGLGARTDLEERVKGMSPMLLCGLALAGANLPPDELGRTPGLITAEEIAALDLSSCELAVLSACDTNVGLRRAGQGVASLQKALHMAGARTVITSLWKVPDEATKELMLDFYRRIWVEKEPKAQALWAAKKELRDARDASGRPPYSLRDWAAWVLSGEPE